ncbi:MAG: hypothetical protein Q7P63_07670 [Verrucomicrobiota bacterium JB022]|nr:hypothetical protein [Verrucomicrobiota bacterium JB022]
MAIGSFHCVSAFPPAPYYTVFGDVRDEFGTLLHPEGASVILSAGGKEVLRQSLLDFDNRGFNYQVRLRIDLQRAGTTPYSSLALGIGTTYTLSVSIGGIVYLPIEMSTPPQTGNPAGRTRLNLTLGVDSDGDGLPDAWEEAQLFHAGIPAGEDGWDLSLLDAKGDFDRDGLSNYQEYVSGTYATDSESYLWLDIAEVLPESVRLDFYAFYGRIYVLQSSRDMENWTVVPLLTTDPEEDPEATPNAFLRANSTGVTSLYVPHAEDGTFYRLIAH